MKDKHRNRTQESERREEEVIDSIRCYGEPVLRSEAFRRTGDETHHLHSSLRDHTLNVCITSARISRFLQEMGIRVNDKTLIQAALCHDLGMVDRQSKYKSRTASWRNHPEESVKVARTIIPDLTPAAEEMIRTHMWPVAGIHPRSREEVILNISDKYASFIDWVSWLVGKKYEARIKERLSED